MKRYGKHLCSIGDSVKHMLILQKGECGVKRNLKLRNGEDVIVDVGRIGPATVLLDYAIVPTFAEVSKSVYEWLVLLLAFVLSIV